VEQQLRGARIAGALSHTQQRYVEAQPARQALHYYGEEQGGWVGHPAADFMILQEAIAVGSCQMTIMNVCA